MIALLELFVGAYLVFVGLMLGSFINLAADRLPRRESVVSPRSHCRNCGRRLNALDLAPVAGYLIRGGRCATCRTPIGASAPLVEFVSGFCMVAAIAWQGPWLGGAVGLALVGLLGTGVIANAMRTRRRGAS